MINSGVKNIISKSFSFLFFNSASKIIISSSGRCGSTMVFNAVVDGLIINKFGHTYMRLLGNLTRDIVSVYLKNLSEISNSHFIVHKNHEPYFEKNNNLDRHIYLFIYGDPLDSALSVDSVVQKKGVDWFYKHQEHLCGKGSYQDLYNKDILNYENIMHSWINANEDNILCIDYDDLWKNENTVSNFVGFDVKFPSKLERERKTKRTINIDLFTKLKKKKISLKVQRQSLKTHKRT
jgi:hypothetical protein